jgi:cytochrome c553
MRSLIDKMAIVSMHGCLVLLAACSQPETTTDHMQEHFTQVEATRAAVISGDLDAAREPARWLARHEATQGVPEGWGQHVVQMQLAAQRIVDANEIAPAAAATAEMGAICGGCHQGMDEGAQFTFVAPPPQEAGVVAHMLRHQWAAQRLWEGLVGPSEEAWSRGVAALAEAPLQPTESPEEVGELASRVHELGTQAGEATGFIDRAKVYGDLLATCAQCHRQMDAGPGTRVRAARTGGG